LDDKKNKGKSMMMDIALRKYIIPNANSQYSHLTKLKLWPIYSQIYGRQPMFVDYRYGEDDGYVGPDCWLVPFKQWYPEPGVNSPNDMSYTFMDTFVTKEWLESRTELRDWDKAAIKSVLSKLADTEGKKPTAYDTQSYAESKWPTGDYGGKGDYAKILLRTKYTRKKWYTYAPDFSDAGLLRDIKNPHENNKLPFVVKETIPLLDRLTGLGDIERGAPMQKTASSLLRLYMDTVKYSLFPPTIVHGQGVVAASLKWVPRAFWYEKTPNSIRQYQLSPIGSNTFQNAMGYVTSSLNNLLGTTDLSVTKNVEHGMGKTPQALKMQAIRESAADSWERQSLDDALGELYDRFIELIAIRQEKPLDIDLFGGELQRIQAIYPDVVEAYSEERGRVVIKPEALKGKYRFYIDPGSSAAKDTALENEALSQMLALMIKTPQVQEALRAKGKEFDFAEAIKRWVITSGVQGAEELIVDFKPPVDGQMGQGIPQGMPMGAPQGGMPQGQPAPQSPMGASMGGDMGGIDPEIMEAANKLMGGM
jgi:hypothetical protein